MTALGALIPFAAEPLQVGLWAVGFLVDLALNFDSEPAVPVKEPALTDLGSLDMAGFGYGFPYSTAVVSVVLNTALTLVEPYIFPMDDYIVNFGSCTLSDASASSPFAAGVGGVGGRRRTSSRGHGGQRNCPQYSIDTLLALSASGGSQRDGDNGNNNNGNGNNNHQIPSPTRSTQGDPAPITTDPPNPFPGGAPPPPPPPPDTAGSVYDDDNRSNSYVLSLKQLIISILVGMVLAYLKARYIDSTSRSSGRPKRTSPSGVSSSQPELLVEDFARAIGENTTTDLIPWDPRMHELVVYEPVAIQPVCAAPLFEGPVVDDIVQQSAPVNQLVNLTTVVVDLNPITNDTVVVVVKPRTGIGLFVNVFLDFLTRLHNTVDGFFKMRFAPKLLLITAMGLVAYYHMLFQDVGLMHPGKGVDAEKFLARLKEQRSSDASDGVGAAVDGGDGGDNTDVTDHSTLVDDDVPLVADDVSVVVEDVSAVAEDVHVVVNDVSVVLDDVPLLADDVSVVVDAVPVVADDVLPPPPVARAPVEHIGGIPITEMDMSPGHRLRRRRHRKKKQVST